MRVLGGKTIGIAPSPDKGTGVATWIPSNSPLIDQVQECEVDPQGRYAVLKVTAEDTHIHVVNVHLPHTTMDWLFVVIKNLPMFKAPGPDGIPNEFYYIMRHNIKLLRIIKEALIAVVHHGLMPTHMSFTHYILIYKNCFQNIDN